MTELEKMQRAKTYLEQLAQGVDPISGRAVPQDGVLAQPRLSRCFSYVAELLTQVMDSGGPVQPARRAKSAKKAPFSLPMECRAAFPFSQTPLRITEITERINAFIDPEHMRKLSGPTITNWLLAKGFLEVASLPGGRTGRQPTTQGIGIGLSSQLRQGPQGDYYAVLYNEDAQHFILDNLEGILPREEA